MPSKIPPVVPRGELIAQIISECGYSTVDEFAAAPPTALDARRVSSAMNGEPCSVETIKIIAEKLRKKRPDITFDKLIVPTDSFRIVGFEQQDERNGVVEHQRLAELVRALQTEVSRPIKYAIFVAFEDINSYLIDLYMLADDIAYSLIPVFGAGELEHLQVTALHIFGLMGQPTVSEEFIDEANKLRFRISMGGDAIVERLPS